MRKIWTLEPRHCRKCNKEIYITPEWAYKDGWGVYCSWKCFNHRFDGLNKVEKNKYKYKRVEQVDPVTQEVVKVHDNAYDAIVEVDGCTQQAIYDACRLGKKYKGYLWRYVKEVTDSDDRRMETDICESTKECD